MASGVWCNARAEDSTAEARDYCLAFKNNTTQTDFSPKMPDFPPNSFWGLKFRV